MNLPDLFRSIALVASALIGVAMENAYLLGFTLIMALIRIGDNLS